MSSSARVPGPLGLETNPGHIDAGTNALHQNRPPGVTCREHPISACAANSPEPAASAVGVREKSGPQWVNKFPGSAKVDDLEPVFREKLKSFLAALKDAGAGVAIAATYRPRKRAYLMHYCVRIVNGEIKASKVPAMAGVDIDWVHEDDAASIKAAQAMMDAYDIVYPPALISRHTERAAVDMSISRIVGKKIKDAEGNEVEIKQLSDLHPVGKSYGVIKLVSDKPHWSDNGT